MNRPDELLKNFSNIFLEKNSDDCYGNSYKDYGKLCLLLFPNGLTLNSKESFDRFGVFSMIVHKVLRLSKALNTGRFNVEKPFDNAKDLAIYSAMLAELLLVKTDEK